jgi:signal transduction histidine kinase
MRSQMAQFDMRLAIARQLIEMHGGTIKAESLGEGQGATW